MDKTTAKKIAEFVYHVRTKISLPIGGKCFCFYPPAWTGMGRREGTSDFK